MVSKMLSELQICSLVSGMTRQVFKYTFERSTYPAWSFVGTMSGFDKFIGLYSDEKFVRITQSSLTSDRESVRWSSNNFLRLYPGWGLATRNEYYLLVLSYR